MDSRHGGGGSVANELLTIGVWHLTLGRWSWSAVEESVKVNGHAGAGKDRHDAARVGGFGVRSIGLLAPGDEGVAVRVEVPNLPVAALAVAGKLRCHVVATGRRGPDLSDERKRVGVDAEFAGIKGRLVRNRDDDDVRYEEVAGRVPGAVAVHGDAVLASVELALQ